MTPVSYLLRVLLNDRPGSLGMLAVQLGAVGADIRSLEVVERGDGYVVDDLVVDLAKGSLPDTLITAAEKVSGVRVDSLRPHAGVLDTHQELELIDMVATGGKDRLQILADYAPRVLRVSWATIISKPGTAEVLRLYGSSGAPETPLERADWLPLEDARTFDPDSTWIPQSWRDLDTRLAAAPLGEGGKVLLLGRIGGPGFRPAEVARLGYLAGIIGTLLKRDKKTGDKKSGDQGSGGREQRSPV
ncbi:amino acid-binding protein [Gordonia aichiensis]|uniref:amino acid-binding protein n=1 Tax=Gordonia aichiensis TaxID=36820 RepID=UPI0032653154